MSAPMAPDWLTARPIAHRGLHDAAIGKVENSRSAALAAISAQYAIECDVQLSGDGEAMVFHDFSLERLTRGNGRIDTRKAQDLAVIAFKRVDECMATLPEFLTLVGGRAPLICEIKSRFNGDVRLADRVAGCAGAYRGPLALKSFDPAVMAHLRRNRARLGIQSVPLGMVAMSSYDLPGDEWAGLSTADRLGLAQFLHWPQTQPDFLSWSLRDLPAATPFLLRQIVGLPVMAWTVRSPEQARDALKWSDQVVFERFRP